MLALATQGDVEARLGRALAPSETAAASSSLEDASAVVIGYCRTDFAGVSPVPPAVAGVVAKMVARSIGRAAEGGFAEQQNSGPFGVRYSIASSAGDVWMTAADKLALRPHRKGGGLVSTQFVGERYAITET